MPYTIANGAAGWEAFGCEEVQMARDAFVVRRYEPDAPVAERFLRFATCSMRLAMVSS